MISASYSSSLPADNCSRIDFIKGAANQLKLRREVKPTGASAPDDTDRRAGQSLDTLEEAIKSGDSRKAEPALSAAEKAVRGESKHAVSSVYYAQQFERTQGTFLSHA